MQYDQETLWNAIYQFIPNAKFVRDNGVYLNLPISTRDAIVEIFMAERKANNMSYESRVASEIIYMAYSDLLKGDFIFGDETFDFEK